MRKPRNAAEATKFMDDFAVSANHIGALASDDGIDALRAAHQEVPFAVFLVQTLERFVEGAEWLASVANAEARRHALTSARERAEALLSQLRANLTLGDSELRRACADIGLELRTALETQP